MLKLSGERVYLAAMERGDCRVIYEEFEYDFEHKTERLYIGDSIECADDWFEDIKKKQHKENIRLGIFLQSGDIIGDIALQSIDWCNRSCTVGTGIAKISNRSRGYGREALRLIIGYAFENLGLERITADTLEHNIGARNSLESVGFIQEGREREAVYFAGKKYDRIKYALLSREYIRNGL